MTDHSNETARELLAVTMMLMRSLSSSMRRDEQGLSPAHVGIMGRVSEAPCSLTELARYQCVRLPTMSRSVSLLVDKGLVERKVTERNRRQTMVSLTGEGKRNATWQGCLNRLVRPSVPRFTRDSGSWDACSPRLICLRSTNRVDND